MGIPAFKGAVNAQYIFSLIISAGGWGLKNLTCISLQGLLFCLKNPINSTCISLQGLLLCLKKPVNCSECTAVNIQFVNNEADKMRKKVVVPQCKASPQHFLVWTNGNDKKLNSGKLVSMLWLRISWSTWMCSMSANLKTMAFDLLFIQSCEWWDIHHKGHTITNSTLHVLSGNESLVYWKHYIIKSH